MREEELIERIAGSVYDIRVAPVRLKGQGEKVSYLRQGCFSSGTMRQNAVMGRVRRVDVGGMIYHALGGNGVRNV
jgi:hypothetical protein